MGRRVVVRIASPTLTTSKILSPVVILRRSRRIPLGSIWGARDASLALSMTSAVAREALKRIQDDRAGIEAVR